MTSVEGHFAQEQHGPQNLRERVAVLYTNAALLQRGPGLRVPVPVF